jgi:hypothetical protein
MYSKTFYIILFLILTGPFANQKSSAQVIDYITRIKIEGGKKITEKNYVIQINERESNGLSEIKISHSPNQKFTLIEAKVIDSYGNTVRKLRNKDITTRSDMSYTVFYQDDLVEEFSLYWNTYPYRIEYSYQFTEEDFFFLTKWSPLLYSNLTTLKSSLLVEIPLEYEISLDYSNEFQFEESANEGKKILKWTYYDFKTAKPEIYSPPAEELIPVVSIVPVKFHYGVWGNTNSWVDFGEWQSELNKGTDVLPYSEMIVVNRLIEGMSDKKEIIRTLYQYLQDKTQYVNVAIDVGGLKSYPASYVSQNKYGDCKALTTYMKAMLNHANIKSFYTIINAGSNVARIHITFPSQQFNHAILIVPLGNDTIWLENISNYLPFNYVGTFTQDRYALMINGKESKLIQTPMLSVADVFEKRTYTFEIADTGESLVTISENLKGEAFETYRYYKTQTSINDQEKRLLRDITIDNFEMIEWEIADPDRNNSYIRIFVSGNCTSPIKDLAGYKVIRPLQIKLPEFEDPMKRKLSVRINFPVNKSDSLLFHLPKPGRNEIQLPKDIDFTTRYGSYKVNYKLINNNLVVSENFLLNSGDIPISEYSEFYSFINTIYNHKKSSSIILK